MAILNGSRQIYHKAGTFLKNHSPEVLLCVRERTLGRDEGLVVPVDRTHCCPVIKCVLLLEVARVCPILVSSLLIYKKIHSLSSLTCCFDKEACS